MFGVMGVGKGGAMARGHSREGLVRLLKGYAARVSGRVRVTRFCREMRVCPTTVYRLFPGGMYELLTAAGLGGRAAKIGRADRGTLLGEVGRLARVLGRTPTRREVMRHGRFSISSYQNVIGGWEKVLSEFAAWERGTREAPSAKSGGGATPATARQNERKGRAGAVRKPASKLAAKAGPELGPPLGFRGLMHAPVTEAGVVHLFGLLGPEVGMAVEHIGTRFPDCIAMRAGPDGKWRRIAVEFELKSSNFRVHGHDATKCDVIVCWEDDWEGCPVEVVELKSVLERAGRNIGTSPHFHIGTC